MSHLCVDERPLADPSPTPLASSERSIHRSSDVPSDTSWDCYQSPLQPQIVTTCADEVQTVYHASWASPIPDSEVTPSVSGPKEIPHSLISQSVGCHPDRPEAQTQNRVSFNLPENSENPFESQSDRFSLSSVHFLTDGGALTQFYSLQQRPVSTITRTPVVPLHLPTHPDQFASGSAQSSRFCLSRITIPKMTLDREYDLCPRCYATPFPTMWTMEYLGCVHCELRIPRAMMGPENFFAPAPAQTPALDDPLPLSTCPLQNRSRRGKSPQPRGRRSVKTLPPTMQKFRSCPFTSSGNISLPCCHTDCSPPPDVGVLSRRFAENAKWVKARKDAVASFSYESCGCTSSYTVSRCPPLFTNQR